MVSIIVKNVKKRKREEIDFKYLKKVKRAMKRASVDSSSQKSSIRMARILYLRTYALFLHIKVLQMLCTY